MEWNCTPSTGLSRRLPSTRHGLVSSTTYVDFREAQPSWTARCLCVVSNTNGVVDPTFIFLPQLLI
jgi:hypothetical protein